MSQRYKFYLDGNLLTDEPIGWEDLTTEIDRDLNLHGLLIKTDLSLTFLGDGYDYLKCVFDANSFCKEVLIVIEEQCSDGSGWDKVVDGIISCVDMEFDMTKCLVKCPIEDNSYFARIKNNQSIEAFPHVGKSKSGVDIPPALLEKCTMFIPSTGVDSGVARYAYRVFELYKFLVYFMSDGEVDFKSTLFDVGGEFEGLFVTNGLHLSTGVPADFQNEDIGSMSFKTLNEEVYKICNTGFTIEIIAGRPTLVVESESYFYGTTVSDTLNNVYDVKKRVKVDLLYSVLSIGSTTTENAGSFPETIEFVGFKEEEYHLTGQCNIDTTFDLLGNWIRSSNVIEDCVVNNNAAYDEDFIFVMALPVSGNVYAALSYDIFVLGVPPYYYNGNLTNNQIALRFLGAIPLSIASYFNNADDEFQASSTVDVDIPSGFISAAVFPDDFTPPNFDTNSNYDAATYRYIAPIGGLYDFHLHTRITNDGCAAGTEVRLYVYDSLMVLKYFIDDPFYTLAIVPIGTTVADVYYLNMLLSTGDRVEIRFNAFYGAYVPGCFQLLTDSYFACTKTSNGGGIMQVYDPEDFKAIEYQFKYPIAYSRFQTIKTNYRNILAFNIDGINQIKPWIENIKYNHMTSEAEITLLGSQRKTTDICSEKFA